MDAHDLSYGAGVLCAAVFHDHEHCDTCNPPSPRNSSHPASLHSQPPAAVASIFEPSLLPVLYARIQRVATLRPLPVLWLSISFDWQWRSPTYLALCERTVRTEFALYPQVLAARVRSKRSPGANTTLMANALAKMPLVHSWQHCGVEVPRQGQNGGCCPGRTSQVRSWYIVIVVYI